MPTFFIPALTFILGFVFAMLASQRASDKGSKIQLEIAQKGHSAEGTVTGIWQPPVAGSFARIYFEFEPEGAGQRVRCCHIDRRAAQHSTSLPAPGSTVGVKYLPDNPGRAVISKLVSRFF